MICPVSAYRPTAVCKYMAQHDIERLKEHLITFKYQEKFITTAENNNKVQPE